MARCRQRAEWLRVGVAVAYIVNRNGWTREPIDPIAVIPGPYRPRWHGKPRPLTEAERAAESEAAWRVLDTAFSKV